MCDVLRLHKSIYYKKTSGNFERSSGMNRIMGVGGSLEPTAVTVMLLGESGTDIQIMYIRTMNDIFAPT